jgi:ribonuclease BN (tRNA processing enzyme)
VKVILLGTNGWYDSTAGNTISILVRAGDFDLVLDAGNGFSKLARYADGCDRPAFVFLSHFHLDHIAGLHTLGLNAFTKGLTLMSGRGGEKALRDILRQPYSADLSAYPFRTDFVELDGGKAALPFSYESLPLRHSSECFGLRMEAEGRTLAYIPDTGDCPNAHTLAAGADLLLAECTFLSGEEDEGWPHLNPEAAARIARDSGAKKLVLVHFEARRYRDRGSRLEAEKAAREIFPDSRAGFDGDEFEL